jgi:hypothetical protein
MALAMGGFVVGVLERTYEIALEALDRSLALSPSSALAFGFSSIIRAWMGDYPTAIEHAKNGIRLSPYDPLIICLMLVLPMRISSREISQKPRAPRAGHR